jgi:hypothetical protein
VNETKSPESSRFERAYVATRYLLGARGAELTTGLASANGEIASLCEALSHQDRAQRAERLARELEPLGRALLALSSAAAVELGPGSLAVSREAKR